MTGLSSSVDSVGLRGAEAGTGGSRKFLNNDSPARTRGIPASVLFLASVVVTAIGWMNREEGYIRPDSGFGFALGIVGLISMFLLCLYSARKRMRVLNGLGRLSSWFRIHMFLGIVGPLAILFHCDFKRGSVNSTVALASMLIVFLSGLIGRFIYTKMHQGVYGRRITLAEAKERYEKKRGEARSHGYEFSEIAEDLVRFERETLVSSRGLIGALLCCSLLSVRAWILCRRCDWKVRRRMRRQSNRVTVNRSKPVLEAARNVNREYVRAVVRLAEVRLYERIFALWHAFHIPFIFLMFLAAAVHVVAVHLY